MLGAIGSERHRAPSPGPPGQRGSRIEVRWPDSHLFSFPCDAPCVVLNLSHLLEELVGSLTKDPLPNRRAPWTSRSGSCKDSGSQPPCPRARSAPREMTRHNPGPPQDVLASLWVIVPQALAGAVPKMDSAFSARSAPHQSPLEMTKPSRTRSETGRQGSPPLWISLGPGQQD